MNAHTDRRTSGAGNRPLSKLQKRRLILEARAAFAALCAMDDLGESAEFDEWRHEACLLCVERPGLTLCRNEDYLPLLRHFLVLQGRQAEADAAEHKAEGEARTWAANHLQRACRQAADVLPDALGYAEGFLRNRNLGDLETATPNDLHRAAYTVERRVSQLRRK